MSSTNETLIRDFYAAVSRGATGDELAAFFDPDARQIEYPSRLRPAGHTRGLDEILAGAELGLSVITDQSYELHAFLEQGDRAAAQFTWRGTLAVDAGGIPAGTRLVAHVGAFYEFRGSRILSQASYDCYEPIASRG